VVDGATVGDVLAAAAARYGQAFSAVLPACRIWVNGEPAEPSTGVGATDEVAVLPPVSGGAGAPGR
jgi:molybdopterin converting factor small subunit